MMSSPANVTSMSTDARPRKARRALARVSRCAVATLLAASFIGSSRLEPAPEFRESVQPLPSLDSAGAASLLSFPTAIKMRRLHLVRPDLIPYPIQLEVYC
jgi:hypothetical protein